MLTLKALAGLLNLFIILSLALFLPAWSFDFWAAWGYLAAFFLPVTFITFYFLKKDPALIGRRLKAGPTGEKRTSQKVIQSLASLLFILMFIIPGFDRRLHWTHVPAMLVILADVAVVCGLVIVFFVFRANSYTSAVIEVADAQKVVDTGPYAVVRHPMYSGAFLMVLVTPVALGSWWGLPFAFLLVFVIVLRLLDEEEFLRRNLPGYQEYSARVKFRLVPGLW
jgi:protein-S-isoprenylcysteine O-methyltransferase Ste14